MSPRGQGLYRLVSKQLPSGDWDWTIWRTDDAATVIGHGISLPSENAKAAAGQTPRALDE